MTYRKSMDAPGADFLDGGEKLEKFFFGKKGGKITGYDDHGHAIYADEGRAHGMTRGGQEVHSNKKHHGDLHVFEKDHKHWKWHDHEDAAKIHEHLADHHKKDRKKSQFHEDMADSHRRHGAVKERAEKKRTGKTVLSEPSNRKKEESKRKWEERNEDRMKKAMVADDGKPGKSLKETSTEELKATLSKLKPTDPGAESRINAIKGELKSRGDGGDTMEKGKQPSETTDLTPEKARQMLHERSGGHGRPITEQQRKFFGAVGGHLPAPGSKAKKSMSYEDLDDFLEKAATPIGGITPGGYKRIKKDQYVKVSKEEHAAHREKEQKEAAAFDPFKALMDPEYGKKMDEWIEEGKEADKPINASVQLKTMLDQGVDTKEIVGVMQDVPRGSILRVQYHPDDPTLTVRKVGSGGQFGDHWQIDTSKLSPEVRAGYGKDLTSSHEIVSVLKTFSEKAKVKAGARPIPEPTKKSMESGMSLEEYIEKSGGLPTHQVGLGHKKSAAVEGGSADGGELAGVGMTSGSGDSSPGPGQDSQGQIKGTGTGKEKLSEDDAEDEKQMKPHKKPIETVKKSRFPADQRDTVAREHAAAVSQLQKSDDVYIGPNRHPYSQHATHASGDTDASELVKSEGFYAGNSPQVAPSRPIIEQGVLCKSVNASGCDATYSAALTACPGCGAGTVGHRHVPGGPVVGAETMILEKSTGPGNLLRRPRQEPDIKIG